MRDLLGGDLDLPPSAQRLNEVDAVFFRETREFVRAKPDGTSLRRFVALLCAYNFFMEATAAVHLAAEEMVLPQAEAEALLACLPQLFALERDAIAAFEASAPDAARFTFGQYMWVPIPSS